MPAVRREEAVGGFDTALAFNGADETGLVSMMVTTLFPGVSPNLARRLTEELVELPLDLRRDQASAGRRFVDAPRLPARPEPRGLIRRGIFGGLIGMALGAFVIAVAAAWERLARGGDTAAARFFRSLGDLVPGRRRRVVTP